MNQEPRSPSWWQTFPGVLTAVAALITALTGLLVASHQAGWLRGPSSGPQAESTEYRRDQGSGGGTETRSPRPTDTLAADLVPSMSQVTVSDATYNLLALRAESHNPQSFGLSITVRMTSHRRGGHNFWDASFRLLVDNVPRAPVSNLNKIVAEHSAEEGEIRFIVPRDAETLSLQIRGNDETTLIPLEWRKN
jgi:hypothetical protein